MCRYSRYGSKQTSIIWTIYFEREIHNKYSSKEVWPQATYSPSKLAVTRSSVPLVPLPPLLPSYWTTLPRKPNDKPGKNSREEQSKHFFFCSVCFTQRAVLVQLMQTKNIAWVLHTIEKNWPKATSMEVPRHHTCSGASRMELLWKWYLSNGKMVPF